MQYESLHGKPIIGIFDATDYGNVTAAVFSKKGLRIRYLKTTSERYLSVADIYASVGDVVLCRKPPQSRPEAEWIVVGMGQTAYDLDGKTLGTLRSVRPNADGQWEIAVAEDVFDLRKIVSSGDAGVVLNTDGRTLRRPAAKRSAPAAPASSPAPQAVRIEEVPLPSSPASFGQLTSRTSAILPPPRPASDHPQAGDYRFLLGKRLIRTVGDMTRGFTIPAGTVVDGRVLEQCRRNGKLVELALSTEPRAVR